MSNKPTLHLDVESFSAVDLPSANAYVYAENESTGLWCAAYAVDDGPVEIWRPGQPVPFEIIEGVHDGWTFAAHNAAFERTMWRLLCVRKYGWPDPSKITWNCTMARALAMALPGSLDMAAKAIHLPIEKDDAGRRLMLKMSRPRSSEGGKHIWWDDEDHRSRLEAYCRQDVEVERQLDKKLLALRPFERDLWALDQKINDRGFAVDMVLVERAREVVLQSTARLDAEMRDVTHGAVAGVSNVQQLRGWLSGFGIVTDSLDKEHLADLLVRDLPTPARRALELREEGSKVSTAKLNKMVACRSPATGRVNGSLQYHAASTGRWGGRGVQPQNFQRPEEGWEGQAIETAVGILRHGPDAMALTYDRPMGVIANLMRSFLVPGATRVYRSADYSNIEGRTLPWLAGEETKLQSFRAFDAGVGYDLYLIAAGKIFGIDPGTAKPFRQMGKVSELALGFQGGPAAFAKMAKTYKLKIGDQFEVVWGAVSEDVREKVIEGWNARGVDSGMPERTWKAGEAIKIPWRAGHPKIQQFWRDLEDTAVAAIESPGQVLKLGFLSFLYTGNTLFVRLPSGRSLVYPFAHLKDVLVPWKGKNGEDLFKPSVRYMGVDSYTKKWQRQATYGGKLAENVTQAVARDVMAEAMMRVEAAGYPIVLTVHDEILVEPLKGQGSLDEFSAIMAESPTWAVGLPIAVGAWEGARYRK
jgi:DNA polymerase